MNGRCVNRCEDYNCYHQQPGPATQVPPTPPQFFVYNNSGSCETKATQIAACNTATNAWCEKSGSDPGACVTSCFVECEGRIKNSEGKCEKGPETCANTHNYKITYQYNKKKSQSEFESLAKYCRAYFIYNGKWCKQQKMPSSSVDRAINTYIFFHYLWVFHLEPTSSHEWVLQQ